MKRILPLLFALLLIFTPIVLLLGGGLLFGVSRDPRKSFFGYRFYAVLTQSMSPTFNKGDVIIVRTCTPDAVQPGDIITFDPNMRDPELNATLTHRVVRVLEELDGEPGLRFVTKGDANPAEDPPILSDMLIGKMTGRLPGMGYVSNAIRNHLGLSLLTAFLLTLLCWAFALLLLRGRRRRV